MKNISIAKLLLIAVLVWPLCASAQKGSIYSWTDENGVKHFSDKAPPANVEASKQQIIEILDQNVTGEDSDSDTLNNETEENPASDAAAAPGEELSYADQQRQAMAERRKAEQEKKAERERFCLQARDQLARTEPSRRVFYTDENGNTARLDDDTRVEMVEESQRQVAEYCD